MAEDQAKAPKLPGNHGQFGVDKATEEHKTLDDQPAPDQPPAEHPGPLNPRLLNKGDPG